jgi:hypothetical protein
MLTQGIFHCNNDYADEILYFAYQYTVIKSIRLEDLEATDATVVTGTNSSNQLKV